MRKIEWRGELSAITYQPFHFLYVNNLKQQIGFCDEILDDLQFNHIVSKLLWNVDVPALDAMKELLSIVETELEQTDLTKQEKQEALKLLGESKCLRQKTTRSNKS